MKKFLSKTKTAIILLIVTVLLTGSYVYLLTCPIAYGMEYALEKVLGKREIREKKIVIPAEVITRENAAKFYFPDSIY